jgi:hypothetical protein
VSVQYLNRIESESMALEAIRKTSIDDRFRLGALIGIGLLSTLVYALGITARYPLVAGLQHPRAVWSTLMGYSLQAGFVHAGLYILLILGYMLALRLALRTDGRMSRMATAVTIVGWLLSSAALLGAYPGESLDIFDYVFRGRMLLEYGASPLAIAPVAFQNRPFYEYITWRGQVDTYGPLWEYASGTVAWIVHNVLGHADSQIAYIIGYRLMAIMFAGLCGSMIAAIVNRSAPQHVSAALLAWLWNPLLLITTAIGAHNDILMILLILAALLLVQRRRWVWGLLTLALAVHVKLTALLILPIVGLWLLRRCGWLRTIGLSALALGLAIPMSWMLYTPLGGWATLRRMLQERARLLINSPADLVYRMLQEHYGWTEPTAWRLTTQGATLLFFVGAAAVLAWLYSKSNSRLTEDERRKTNDRRLPSFVFRPSSPALSPSLRSRVNSVEGSAPNLASNLRRPALRSRLTLRVPVLSSIDDALLWRGSMAVTLAYLLIGSFWFQHWYLLWVLAPAALLPANRWALTFVPAYCLGALWSDLTNSFLRGIAGRPFTATQIVAFSVLAQVAPLLCAIVVVQLWRHIPWLFAAITRRSATLRTEPAMAQSGYEMDNLP